MPVVEPDIVNNGTHDIGTSARTTEKVFAAFYKAMSDAHVCLEGTLLKPAFVTPGTSPGGHKVTAEEVADATLKAFRRCVPSAVSGVCFLSGGLGESNSTLYLATLNARKGNLAPWPLTFSYGRALTGGAWKAYGKDRNVKEAQKAFIKRCVANSNASKGVKE